jgi:hypothetical protein
MVLSNTTETFAVPESVTMGSALIWIEVADDIVFHDSQVSVDIDRVV